MIPHFLLNLLCVVTPHCLVVSAFVNLSRRVAVHGCAPSNYAVKPLCCTRDLGSSLSASFLDAAIIQCFHSSLGELVALGVVLTLT